MPLAEECDGPVLISGGHEMDNDRERLESESTPPMEGQAISRKDLSDDELVPVELGLGPELRQELLRRIRDYFENPETAISLDEVIKIYRRRLRGLP